MKVVSIQSRPTRYRGYWRLIDLAHYQPDAQQRVESVEYAADPVEKFDQFDIGGFIDRLRLGRKLYDDGLGFGLDIKPLTMNPDRQDCR